MIYEDIQLRDICEKVDTLGKVKHFSSLPPIYGAGQIRNPKIALVFINPTHRNISSSNEWEGLRAPWIGVKNIWRMFFQSGLITPKQLELTQRSANWNEEFTLNHYRKLAQDGYYITNLVKWTGSDARLPQKEMINEYREILKEELSLLNPVYVIAFGHLTFSALVQHLRSSRFSELVPDKSFKVYDSEDFKSVVPSYFPVGQGIKNWDKAVRTVKMVVNKISRS